MAIDGPRPDRPGEAERVQACRDLWRPSTGPCEVQTLFQDSQPRLRAGGDAPRSPGSSTHEERGIILEDDIIPDPSLLPASAPSCSTGTRTTTACSPSPAATSCRRRRSRTPSRPTASRQVPHIWGWATWRRSWAQHRLDIAGWRSELPPTRLWARAGHSLPGERLLGAAPSSCSPARRSTPGTASSCWRRMVVRPADGDEQRQPHREHRVRRRPPRTRSRTCDELRPVEPIALPTAAGRRSCSTRGPTPGRASTTSGPRGAGCSTRRIATVKQRRGRTS